jgi:hypothetical protein
MFKHQNDRGNRKLWCQGFQKFVVDFNGTNVMKPWWDGSQDLDWISTLFAFSVANIEVCGECENEQDEGMSQNGDEKEQPS